MSAETIQEYLFYAMGGLLPVAVIVNLIYNLVIGGFFTELEEQDPPVWQDLGSPRAGDNFKRQRSTNKGLFLFVPVLRRKAKLSDYPRARRAWLWFRLAAVATGSTFALAGGAVIFMLANDLS